MFLHGIQVIEGTIYVHFAFGHVDVYTCSNGCGDLVYQFGCECRENDVFKLVMDNYQSLHWDFLSDT